jgi:alpha-glucosidase
MVKVAWWKSGVIYEIYPRSFQDSDNDGFGDLQGIRRRLDYFKWLGIDAIWIAPIFVSPMADNGYDVSDYRGIDPLYGTLNDFDQLLNDAHANNIKVILDFVPNHTSDQHPWFKESRSSRQNAKRDWYIWRDGRKACEPPNNWVSQFGGPAWTLDVETGQYYLHSFLRQQPDLNWRNESVRRAMYDVLRFWLDRGVDGFRVDVLWLLIKDIGLRDNPLNPNFRRGDAEINRYLNIHNGDQPEIHEVVAQMRSVLDEYKDRVLIGEIYLPLERLVSYYGNGLGAQLPFNFLLINAPWNAASIAKLVQDYEGAIPGTGWPNWVLGNHDQPRIAARVGDAQARVAAMLLLSLRGTPTMYYGDEIGLTRVHIPADLVRDPWEKTEPGLSLGRDPSRTPFQWDSSPNAGFTNGRPWLPIDCGYQQQNVQALKSDPRSLLSLYVNLLQLRRRHYALSLGLFKFVAAEGNILSYMRSIESENIFVALNFGNENSEVPIREYGVSGAVVLCSTHCDRTGNIAGLTLRANEGVILLVSPKNDGSEFPSSQ